MQTMLNKEIISLLNEQIWLENHSSCFYLDLAIEFGVRGFNGISKFFYKQSEEERSHMLKLIQYVIEKECKPTIPQYNYMEPSEEPFDVLFHFECALEQEKKITEQVFKVIEKSREVLDYTTDNFMSWFVTEQREEENKFKEIIDKLKIIGDSGLSLYHIDKELSSL